MNDIKSILLDLFTTIPAFLICLTIHEAAHGYTAYLLGDDTAKRSGRLSFNPLHHIDPIGLICLVFLRFGWAKPVECNSANFKNPRVGMAIVAFAGPLSNFILGFAAAALSFLSALIDNHFFIALSQFLYITAWYSVMLGIFNAIPLPILDGFHIISPILPKRILSFIYQYWQYMWLILIILIYSQQLSPFLANATKAVVSWMYDIIFKIAAIFS